MNTEFPKSERKLDIYSDEIYWLGFLRAMADRTGQKYYCISCKRLVVGSGKTFVCPLCRRFIYTWPGIVRAFLQLYGEPGDVFLYNLLGAPVYYWHDDLSGATAE